MDTLEGTVTWMTTRGSSEAVSRVKTWPGLASSWGQGWWEGRRYLEERGPPWGGADQRCPWSGPGSPGPHRMLLGQRGSRQIP